MEPVRLDDEVVATFARDGVACLRSVLDPGEVAAAAAAIDAVLARPGAWRTSPPFDGLHAELPAGAALDHPLFPVVWPVS
jgi:hypothetical protein